MTDLTGKTALITGSARGLGRAIALRYAALGANIVLNYSSDAVNAQSALEQVRALGAQAIMIRADISEPEQLERLYTEALSRFGSLEIVAANAGLELINTPVVDATDEQIDRLLAVNVRGAFFTLQKAAKYVSDNGRILYVGSTASRGPVPGMGPYGSTKLAPIYLAEVLALELAHRGVTVNTILPTAIDNAGVFAEIADDSPMREQLAAARLGGRIGRLEDVADAAEYLVGRLASWVSGNSLVVSGGVPQ